MLINTFYLGFVEVQGKRKENTFHVNTYVFSDYKNLMFVSILSIFLSLTESLVSYFIQISYRKIVNIIILNAYN